MSIEKEIITTESMLKDCKRKSVKESRSLFLTAPIVLLLSVWLIFSLITTKTLKIKLILFLILFFALLALIITFDLLPSAYKNLKTVVHGKIEIKTDKLVHKVAEIKSAYGGNNRPYTLQFSQSGKFNIYNGTFYSSSKQYKMSYHEVFRTAKLEDKFYLVTNNENEILMVYNTKFFELKSQ